MKKGPIKVNYVVLCDDIRAEDNGKHILIGVYNDVIIIPSEAERFIGPIGFYVSITLPPEKAVPVTMWIGGPNDERVSEVDWGMMGVVGGPETNKGVVVWKLLPWRSGAVGVHKLHMTQEEHDAVIYEFELRH